MTAIEPATAAAATGEPAAQLREHGCSVCGAEYHAGPEADAWHGTHCWRCGFRPGQTIPAHVAPAANVADLRRQIIAELAPAIAQDVAALFRETGQAPTVAFADPQAGQVS